MAAPPCQCQDCYYQQGHYYNPSPADQQAQYNQTQYNHHQQPQPQPQPHDHNHQQQQQHHDYSSPPQYQQQQYYYANQPPIPAPQPQPPHQVHQPNHVSPMTDLLTPVGQPISCTCSNCNNPHQQPYPSDPYDQNHHYQQHHCNPPPDHYPQHQNQPQQQQQSLPPQAQPHYQAQQYQYQHQQPYHQQHQIKPESEELQYKNEHHKPQAPIQNPKQNRAGSRANKAPHLTEESKVSGYSQFYKYKRKQLPKNVKKFGDISQMIAEAWKKLSDEEKATYTKDVSDKRKESARNKAKKQAQELLQTPQF